MMTADVAARDGESLLGAGDGEAGASPDMELEGGSGGGGGGGGEAAPPAAILSQSSVAGLSQLGAGEAVAALALSRAPSTTQLTHG